MKKRAGAIKRMFILIETAKLKQIINNYDDDDHHQSDTLYLPVNNACW
jgi:hypothetical protein